MVLELASFDDPIIVNGIGHLDYLIEELEKVEPKKKKSIEHKVWRRDYNTVVDAMNKLAGFKRVNLKK